MAEERRLWAAGHRRVAGMDEVGRGAWAGPVSVGVAVIRPGCTEAGTLAGLRDSKLLTPRRREALFPQLAAWCEDWAVGHAAASECDHLGMVGAVRLAGLRALAALAVPPDAILMDGPLDLLRQPAAPVPPVPPGAPGQPGQPGQPGAPGQPGVPGTLAGHPGSHEQGAGTGIPAASATLVPVVGGDRVCASVAAASVLAKVVRDRMMGEEARHFPAYDFQRNKGYPSPTHRTALQGYGLTALHRRSWSYVADLPWR